jgi:hypothetical protein
MMDSLPMPEQHDVNHGDILRAIGQLEGKIEGMLLTVQTNQADIAEAFRRLNKAEQRIAQGVILAVVISIIMPILVTMAAPRLEFGPARVEHSK